MDVGSAFRRREWIRSQALSSSPGTDRAVPPIAGVSSRGALPRRGDHRDLRSLGVAIVAAASLRCSPGSARSDERLLLHRRGCRCLIIAAITDTGVAGKVLVHVGLAASPPRSCRRERHRRRPGSNSVRRLRPFVDPPCTVEYAHRSGVRFSTWCGFVKARISDLYRSMFVAFTNLSHAWWLVRFQRRCTRGGLPCRSNFVSPC